MKNYQKYTKFGEKKMSLHNSKNYNIKIFIKRSKLKMATYLLHNGESVYIASTAFFSCVGKFSVMVVTLFCFC